MSGRYTAIIHLHRPVRTGDASGLLGPLRRVVRGVREASYEPAEALITVEFDGRSACLADLVRTIEDNGLRVSSVAQRGG